VADPTVQSISWSARVPWRRLASVGWQAARQAWLYERRKRRFLRHRPAGFEVFSPVWLRQATPFGDALARADVVVLHWLGKLLDFPSFFASAPADKPIVWVLHDMHPFTGGCHFSAGCQRFTEGCGCCPQLDRAGPDDLSAEALSLKTTLYARLALHVAAPSRWLTELARRSRAFAGSRSFHTIPYGIDAEAMRPIDKREAKRRLGLDPERLTVGFGAADCRNPRKGMVPLAAAWRQLSESNPVGLLFGGGASTGGFPDDAAVSFGYVDDPHRQALIYAAADVFVLPSLEDNLPQTGLEAMACGTPVVAFAAGGIPEYVRHEETGLLAPVGDAEALAGHLRRMLADGELRRRLGHAARRAVEQQYAAPSEAEAYRDLFGRLLASDFGGSGAWRRARAG
jgi:glycosyltransferase involved in cell wall biosynthesis